MGNTTSNSFPRVIRSSKGSEKQLRDEQNYLFCVPPDELTFSIQFSSHLLSKTRHEVEKPLILPHETTIVDILTEPDLLTNEKIPESARLKVLLPLFIGLPESKPFLHQVLNEFISFLSERSIQFLTANANQIHQLVIKQKKELD